MLPLVAGRLKGHFTLFGAPTGFDSAIVEI